MLNFEEFYKPLSYGQCVGESFKKWWINVCGNNHTMTKKCWYYGMCILGDPLVSFEYTNQCENNIEITNKIISKDTFVYSQDEIIVGTCSIEPNVLLSLNSKTIKITGPFTCSNGATFIATSNDYCKCNNHKMSSKVAKHTNQGERQYANESLFDELSNIQYFVYPNPSHDIINISSDADIQEIKIYNLMGTLVLITNQTTIDISLLPYGVYIIHSIDNNQLIYQSTFIRQ